MSINITIIASVHHRDGWWYATSDQLDGLIVANPDLDKVKSELPLVIKAMYKAQFNKEVNVIKTVFPHARLVRSGDRIIDRVFFSHVIDTF